MSELSDELLVAYVDGQLARAQSIAVKRVIDYDDVASERVGSLRDANKRLEEAFDAMLREKPQAPDEPAAQASDAEIETSGRVASAPSTLAIFLKAYGGLVIALAALAMLGLGGGLGYLLTNDIGGAGASRTAQTAAPVPDWQRDVVRIQALFGRETLEVSLESQANRELVRFQLSNALGPRIVVPDLEAEGLRFVRAQLLRSGGAPLAQISYLPEKGAPIALYAKAQGEGEQAVHDSFGGAGVRTRAWLHNGIAYLLAGEVSETDIVRLADAVKTSMTAP